MTIRMCRHDDCEAHCWDDETGRDAVPPVEGYVKEVMCPCHFDQARAIDKAAGRDSMTRAEYLSMVLDSERVAQV